MFHCLVPVFSELDELAARLSRSLSLEQGGQPLDMKQMIYLANPEQLEFLRKRVVQDQHSCLFDDEEIVNKFLEVAESNKNGDGDSACIFPCLRNQIMLPTVVDAFDQMPPDLRNDWMCIVCPEGTRVLVVAAYRTTRVYDLEGTWICEHDTHLPGGSPSNISKVDDKDECTILDCLYDDEQEIYFILEVLCWKGTRYYKSEARDRLNATLEKIKAVPTLKQVAQSNPFRFYTLPLSYVCHNNALCSIISRANFTITGLLFYHKKALYIPGVTPLGIWIETGYISHVLDIQVHKLEYGTQPGDGSAMRRQWKKNRYEMSPEESYPVHNSAFVSRYHPAYNWTMQQGFTSPWSIHPAYPPSYGHRYSDYHDVGYQHHQPVLPRQSYEQNPQPKKDKKEKKNEKKKKKKNGKTKNKTQNGTKTPKKTTDSVDTDSSWVDISTDFEADKADVADDDDDDGVAVSGTVAS
ncbi:hypothetical protein ACOMHN_031620 [Nucella lapillus]